MALELRQQLKLTQQLVMTPQLQQAIKLLQLSRLELSETLQQEIEQNPMLEEDISAGDSTHESLQDLPPGESPEALAAEKTTEVSLEGDGGLKEIDWSDYENEYESSGSFKAKAGDELPSRLDILVKKTGLEDHLVWQLKFNDLTERELEVGQFIIGNLSRDGFLEVDDEDIAAQTEATPESVQKMLALIQDMDPPGVAARGIKECLLLQLSHLKLSESAAGEIVRNQLKLLETKNYAAIVKATRYSLKEVLAAVDVITALNPHPGRAFSNEEPHYIIPDVYVYKMDGEYVIMLNDDGLPRLRISNFYKDILKEKNDTPGVKSETKLYIQDKMKSAMWLIKSIQQRQRTIYKVVESLIKFQLEFFEKGSSQLRPLILRDVADDIGMHESTISRVTTNKYVHTPQGIYELKYFFNSSIERTDGEDAMASESVKVRMRQIIQGENPEKPLSDMAITKFFEGSSIKIARRTIAKYREQLGILPSKYRKKPKLK
jgi:RNA polymerase sigma-54 factor